MWDTPTPTHNQATAGNTRTRKHTLNQLLIAYFAVVDIFSYVTHLYRSIAYFPPVLFVSCLFYNGCTVHIYSTFYSTVALVPPIYNG